MKPDKYYNINELEQYLEDKYFSEEDLLESGSEGSLQFYIKKSLLEAFSYPGCVKGVEYYCPYSAGGNKNICSKQSNLKFIAVAPETIERLKTSKNESLIRLIPDCADCTDCDERHRNEKKMLEYNIFYHSFYYEQFQEPIYDPITGQDVAEEHDNDRYCTRDDLYLIGRDIEQFEAAYLAEKPPSAQPHKSSTFLKLIGALIAINYNNSPYINNGKLNANSLAAKIHKDLSEDDYETKGLSERTLRVILPKAFDEIKSNKI